MAADLHLHSTRIVDSESKRTQLLELGADALNDITENDLRCFKSNSLGSRFFSLGSGCSTSMCLHWRRIMESDSVDLGEVSYLKAAIFDDDSYVPSRLERVAELIDENMPLLDADLAIKIVHALRRDVSDRESAYDATSDGDDHDVELCEFLGRNIGARLFLVAW